MAKAEKKLTLGRVHIVKTPKKRPGQHSKPKGNKSGMTGKHPK